MKTWTKLPLSPYEVCLVPFYDPLLANDMPMEARSQGAQCQLLPNWDHRQFVYSGYKGEGPFGSIHISLSGESTGYNELVFWFSSAERIKVRLRALCDGNWRESVIESGEPGRRTEWRGPLEPCDQFGPVEIVIEPGDSTAISGTVELFSLNLARMPEAGPCRFPQRKIEPSDWDHYLEESIDWSEPRFACGLLFDPEDLPRLRKRMQSPTWAPLVKRWRAQIDEWRHHAPEDDLSDFLPWTDERYQRIEGRGRPSYYLRPLIIGLVGLLDADEALCRLALRYLFCMLETRHWTISAYCRTPGSNWDQRAFLEEMTTTSCALLLDWFHFALGNRCRDLAATILWDQGISYIERDLLRHPYMHRMNQGIWFSRGRILGLIYLSTRWEGAERLVEPAVSELEKMVEAYIAEDGSTHEGIGYFGLALEMIVVAMAAWARQQGKPLAEVMPERVRRTIAMLETFSRSTPGRFHTVGDATSPVLVGDGIPVLAGLYPDAGFERFAHGDLGPEVPEFSYFRHYVGTGLYAFLLGRDTLGKPDLKLPFVSSLPNLGAMSLNYKTVAGDSLQLVVLGGVPEATHTHPDIGSFLFEYVGEPVFVDPGKGRYDDPRCELTTLPGAHNLLVPFDANGNELAFIRPAQPCIPVLHKEAGACCLAIDVSGTWLDGFESLTRQWDVTEDGLVIHNAGRAKAARSCRINFISPFKPEAVDRHVHACLNSGRVLECVLPAESAFSFDQPFNDTEGNLLYRWSIHASLSCEFSLTLTFKFK
jgi:hypothetical protein